MTQGRVTYGMNHKVSPPAVVGGEGPGQGNALIGLHQSYDCPEQAGSEGWYGR
ncbi:hypothetical protein [Streptomyces luteogriseus]|uniref:Uncharacterized protein n=1 Tax=Streptomyces luteogriseus TaxID=68233 RepID=A0A7W7DP09_9ACTN|nr:hypothetical protein [Streptomyces luteogriseus]MBB4714309.1 hypothetical protein [Streptomyces luteogriseus]